MNEPGQDLHLEFDRRLTALEAQDVNHQQELIKLEDRHQETVAALEKGYEQALREAAAASTRSRKVARILALILPFALLTLDVELKSQDEGLAFRAGLREPPTWLAVALCAGVGAIALGKEEIAALKEIAGTISIGKK